MCKLFRTDRKGVLSIRVNSPYRFLFYKWNNKWNTIKKKVSCLFWMKTESNRDRIKIKTKNYHHVKTSRIFVTESALQILGLKIANGQMTNRIRRINCWEYLYGTLRTRKQNISIEQWMLFWNLKYFILLEIVAITEFRIIYLSSDAKYSDLHFRHLIIDCSFDCRLFRTKCFS